MEKGFILPNGSYIQAIDAEHLTAADYPDGTVEVPLKPGSDYEWTGSKWAELPPPPVTPDQVKAERVRRLEAGTVIEVTGYGPVPVQGRAQDQITLLSLENSARNLLAAGVSDPLLPFRDRDNAQHRLTPAQVLELIRKAKAHAQAMYQASWDMIDAETIPQDYTDDKHWP